MAKQNVDIEVGIKDKGASGFLDSIAAKARQLRREDALSGEKALGGFLNKGAGGLAEFGLSAVGLGAKALIAEAVGRMAEAVTHAALEVEQGKKTISDVISEFGKSIPIVGTFGRALENVVDLIFHISSRQEANDRESAGNQRSRDNATSVRGRAEGFAGDSETQSRRQLIAATLSPTEATKALAADQLKTDLDEIQKQMDAVNALEDKYASEKKRSLDILQKAKEDRQKAYDAAEAKRKHDALTDATERTVGMEFGAKESGLKLANRDLDLDLAQIRERARRAREAIRKDDTLTAAQRIRQENAVFSATDDDSAAARKRAADARDSARDQITDLQAQRRRLLNPESNYSAHGEQAIGGRFSTGQSELLLMRTANTDTARNTGEMKRLLDRIDKGIAEQTRIIQSNTENSGTYSGGN